MTASVGLVGYGVGGRYFHSPYIVASETCRLAGIVARSPGNLAAARADHPGVPIFETIDDMLDAGVDAVTVSTPPATRHDLAVTAIERGVAVLADKPFAPSAAAGRELVHIAEEAGVLLNVFHNRRWDADIVTARGVIDSHALGKITRLDLRCDQDDVSTLERGPEGGLLRDLGSHVVDQALSLLGPAIAVSAQLDVAHFPEGATDTGFVITLIHASGAHSHISASKMNHLSSRELRLHGEHGSYSSNYSDVQFEAVRAGRRPAADREAWGWEHEDRWGVLAVTDGSRPVPARQGDYTDLYDAFGEAVLNGGTGPVPAAEGVAVLYVLDAARRSASTHRTVALQLD